MKQNLICKQQFQRLTRRMLTLLLSLILFGSVYAQERTLTGTITDKASVTLPGVNVVIKGTTTGVVSDANGKYSIKAADKNSVLVFSFIGYA